MWMQFYPINENHFTVTKLGYQDFHEMQQEIRNVNEKAKQREAVVNSKLSTFTGKKTKKYTMQKFKKLKTSIQYFKKEKWPLITLFADTKTIIYSQPVFCVVKWKTGHCR